ncbi:MAG: NUDIX hydrolase [Alphaproteobacteria bacterium]
MSLPQKSKDMDSAGIVIYGTNRDGKRAFVMPYTEGRFGEGDKYYVLPAGKIDPGETQLQAAIRETEEETGISLEKLLGSDALEKLQTGKTLTLPLESPGYPGVRVVRLGLDPVVQTYISRGHVARTVALYGIEVEGIENLAGHLKNPDNAATPDFKVNQPIKPIVSDNNKYPQLSDFLSWMRSGQVPDADWSRGKEILEPITYGDMQKFQRIERDFMRKKNKEKITNLQEWKEFCEKMPKADFSVMRKIFAKIKNNISAMGITKGDHEIIKLDDKDTPLQFFQEGADVITAEDYLNQCKKMMEKDTGYASGFGGARAADTEVPQNLRTSPKLTITGSQLAAVVPFVPVRELFAGFGKKNTRQAMSLLPCGNGWKDNHPDYWKRTVDGVLHPLSPKELFKPPQLSASARISQSEFPQSAQR